MSVLIAILFLILMVLMVFTEAYHDVYRAQIEGHEYDFMIDRKAKLIKMALLIEAVVFLSLAILLNVTWKIGIYGFLFRAFTFDIFHDMVRKWDKIQEARKEKRLLRYLLQFFKELVLHSEIAYWFQIIFRGRSN